MLLTILPVMRSDASAFTSAGTQVSPAVGSRFSLAWLEAVAAFATERQAAVEPTDSSTRSPAAAHATTVAVDPSAHAPPPDPPLAQPPAEHDEGASAACFSLQGNSPGSGLQGNGSNPSAAMQAEVGRTEFDLGALRLTFAPQDAVQPSVTQGARCFHHQKAPPQAVLRTSLQLVGESMPQKMAGFLAIVLCMPVWAGGGVQLGLQPGQQLEARHPVHLSIRLESQDLSDRCGLLSPLCVRFITQCGLHNVWMLCEDLVEDLMDVGFPARREVELLAEWVHRHSTTGLISCRKLWLFNNR